MRVHNRFAYLWPKYDDTHVRRTLRADSLVAVRFEPVYSLRFEAYMDLLFERDSAWLVIPMLRVDGVSIMVPENPPMTWPQAYLPYAGAEVEAIEARVVPWLRSIATGRLVNDEVIRFFREDSDVRRQFDDARSASWIGASPYPEVVRSIAPAAYALRFARDRRVALVGEHAANGAAILSAVAASMDIDSRDAQRDAAARRWFGGLTLSAIEAARSYDCYVGPRADRVNALFAVYTDPAHDHERSIELAEPIPTDVMLSFDTQDAPAARSFAVAESTVPIRPQRLAEPAHGGGSGGCIRLVVRDEAMRFGDADLDAARELARGLCAEGFDAQISIASRIDVEKTDVIHVFDLRHDASLVELLRDAQAARVPVVVTPYADDRKNEATSGCSGSLLIPRCTNDTTAFEDYVRAFADRKISNLTQAPWYDDTATTLLACAAAAIVASPAEAQFLRERFGYSGLTVPVAATVPLEPATDAVASLVGPDEYILVHAPIEPRTNQLFAALAAQRHGLPLVLLGPVADIEFYRYVNEISGPGVVQLRDEGLRDEEIAGIYGRARVVADLSWSSRGLHRLARGASMGAALVASANGYAHDLWGDLVRIADPANLESIAEAFRGAWESQPRVMSAAIGRTVERCDPFAGLVAVVSAYQKASLTVRA